MFEPKGNSAHPKLRNVKTGEWMALPTTLFDGPVRHKYEAALRRLGADLTFSRTRTRETVTPPVFADGMSAPTPVDMPWTDAEWRERQRESDVWWREQQYAPDSPDSPKSDEAVVRPEVPAWSAYGRELMDRLDRGAVRDDARGDTWTLAAARQLVKDGYSVAHAVKTTGWGRMWFADLV